MAVIGDSDIADLGKSTLRELGRMRFNQIASELQSYEIMGRMLRKDRMMFSHGLGLQRNIMTRHTGNVRQVGLHGQDEVNQDDVMEQMQIDFRHTTGNYVWERRELLYNRNFSEIYDLLKSRRADLMIAWAEHLEDQGWSAPSSSSDKLNWWGIPYWIVKNSTTTGFNAENPSFAPSGRGGIDSTAHTRWANYAFNYGSVTKLDAIAKMRTAMRKIRFKSPVKISDYSRGSGDNYRIYVNETTMQDFENLGEGQNENLGRDLASMDDTMMFRRNPVIWVPKLDDDSDNPIYFINFRYAGLACLSGDYMRETEPDKVEGQHNTWAVYVDLTSNFAFTDLRCQAVGVQA